MPAKKRGKKVGNTQGGDLPADAPVYSTGLIVAGIPVEKRMEQQDISLEPKRYSDFMTKVLESVLAVSPGISEYVYDHGMSLHPDVKRPKRVMQEDEAGCGIACVAMVTGKTYLQAKRFFLERIFLPTDRKPHTRHYQLRRALRELGIATEKRPFRHWRSIETDAIVPINRRRDGGWHWVVFVRNGNRPYILDPAPGKGRRRFAFRGMKARGFYIAIPP